VGLPPRVGERGDLEIVKLALDVWYELWENVGSESEPDSEQPLSEGSLYYSQPESYPAWLRDEETRSEYYA
jgi:hypothetical protein